MFVTKQSRELIVWRRPGWVNNKTVWSLILMPHTHRKWCQHNIYQLGLSLPLSLSRFMHKCIKCTNEDVRVEVWQHLWDKIWRELFFFSAIKGAILLICTAVAALPLPKIVLTSCSIHQRRGWLPRYKQLPLQLDLMTLRGRQICSSGSSYVLFINLLKRHLTLLHQSTGAPARVLWSCLPASDWLRCSSTSTWPTSVAGGPGHEWRQQTCGCCHHFYLQHHSGNLFFFPCRSDAQGRAFSCGCPQFPMQT